MIVSPSRAGGARTKFGNQINPYAIQPAPMSVPTRAPMPRLRRICPVLLIIVNRTRRYSEHLLDESATVEGREVFQFFAGADEARGNAKLILNRDHDTAFAAPGELRDNESSEIDRGVKFSRLS